MSGSSYNRSGMSSRSGRTSKTSISVKIPSAGNNLEKSQTNLSNVIRNNVAVHPRITTNNYNNSGNRKFSSSELQRILAVQKIERVWISYRDRQMYKLLKHAVCAAEHSLSYEILRKVCPKEAEFLKDKLSLGRVRFRFGGGEFPPMIFFKIYADTSRNDLGLQYISGKRMIQPASEAAQDACELMGHRKFYDQILQDIMHHQAHKITDKVDVTTLRDYMQYVSLIDETPCYLGGKDNSWRKLTLEVLPRQTIFYDVVEYLYCNKLAPRLKEAIPKLLLLPNNEETLLEHIKIISEIKSPSPVNYIPKTAPLNSDHGTSRRSRQAKQRASKLRKIYGLENRTPSQQEVVDPEIRNEIEDENWEDEADKLYEWTQELSFDDLTLTPRINTGQLTG